jgi:hypothetical protein
METALSRAIWNKSCGCVRYQLIGEKKTTHGHYRGKKATPTRKAWEHMIDRCFNPNGKDWPEYGGRGITVCEHWQGAPAGFLNFLADMGEKPSGLSLDRVYSSGNYEPKNCRWATPKQQRRNSRQRLRYIMVGGENLPMTDWCERLGISVGGFVRRVHTLGGDYEAAVSSYLLQPPRRLVRFVEGRDRPITVDGKIQPLSQWARELGISPSAITMRAKRHSLSLEEAIRMGPRMKPGPQGRH